MGNNTQNTKDKHVIFLSENGYKISTIFGKIICGGRSFDNLKSACNFCESAGLTYFVA